MNESKYERMSIEDFDKYVNVRIEIEHLQEKGIVKRTGVITKYTTGDRKISQNSKTIEDRIPFVCEFEDDELQQIDKIPVRNIRDIEIINE